MKNTGLLHGVLAKSCIENENDFVGGAGEDFVADATDFF